MNNGKKIRPVSMILLLLGLLPSLWLAFTAIRGGYLPNKILFVLLGILAIINVICILIGLLAKHKWLQCILSILLLLISAGGIFADKMFNQVIDYAGKVFTEIPETTEHSTYLLNHTYYMIKDEIDNKEVEIGILDHYNTFDYDAVVKSIEGRNVTLKLTMDSPYNSFYSLMREWNRVTHDNVTHYVMSTILSDELVELRGEVWSTEVLLSNVKIKHQYTEEVSTALPEKAESIIGSKPFTVLIGGNDARGIKTDEDFLNRSAANLLLTVNPETRTVLLTVLPLDLLVEINGQQDRLTDTTFYGISCWEECVEKLMGIDIDYFVRFNFSRIAELIDMYGGIIVDNPYGFRTYRDIRTEDGWYDPAWYFNSGEIELTGDKALVYMREVKHLANGHDAQWNNMKRVFTALWDKIKPEINDISFRQQNSIPDTIQSFKDNIQKCRSLIDKAERFLATDIDADELLRFIIKDSLSGSGKWNFRIQEIHADYNKYPCYSANGDEMFSGVMYEDELQAALQKIHDVLGY